MDDAGVMEETDSGLSSATVNVEFIARQMLDSSLTIAERWWALFTLRNMRGSVAREALITTMRDPSKLLAHEAAFALGQMQDAEAIPALRDILEDVHSVAPIVRHEAAEALGAIGVPEGIELLKNSLESDPAAEVRETCELALRRIEQGEPSSIDDDGNTSQSPFFSVDPAGPAPNSSTPHLRKMLLDEFTGMYDRYAALFALRNRADPESVDSIIAALGAKSALLRHEVAYVLGQLQNKAATDALVRTLRDCSEHPMVRHEAAEALGAIADADSVALIEEFQSDPELLVAQSCEVALSVLYHELHNEPFQFTNFPVARV